MTRREPPEDEPWRGPGPLYWLAMAFALACLIAAAVVAVRFGVFAHHPPPHSASARASKGSAGAPRPTIAARAITAAA